jgi:hypothetical protein
MTTTRNMGYGNIFEVPDYVNYRGRKYFISSSYTMHRDVAYTWAKHTNDIFPRMIVRVFSGNDKNKNKKIYQLYKKILNDKESKAYYKKLGK